MLQEEEIWHEIRGYEGYYEVSTYGRVRSIDRYVIQSKSLKPYWKKGKLLKLAKESQGYKVVSLRRKGLCETAKVHRLVAIAFIPNPESKPFVNHINGKKDCNYKWNLEWNTQAENNKHAIETGLTITKGEFNGNAKLSESQVIEIRKFLLQGISGYKIAKMYNVTQVCVSYIKLKKSWKHLK